MEASRSRCLMKTYYLKLVELEQRRKKGNNLNFNSDDMNISHKDMDFYSPLHKL